MSVGIILGDVEEEALALLGVETTSLEAEACEVELLATFVGGVEGSDDVFLEDFLRLPVVDLDSGSFVGSAVFLPMFFLFYFTLCKGRAFNDVNRRTDFYGCYLFVWCKKAGISNVNLFHAKNGGVTHCGTVL